MHTPGGPDIDDLLREMIAPAGPSAHDRARRRRLLASAATVGLAVVGFSSLTTSALFTDNDAVAGDAFTAGTVKVGLAPTQTFLSVADMVPGDVVHQPLEIRNEGSLGYRYAVEKSALDVGAPLSEQLVLAVYAVPAAASCTPGGVAGLEPLRAAAPVAADGVRLLGDRTTGAQGGDRLVVAAGSEVLCFEVALPLETDNAFQGASTTVSVTVLAEQSANND